MKSFKQLYEQAAVPTTQDAKAIEAWWWRIKVGEVIEDDPRLARMSAVSIKGNWPPGRGMQWSFAKSRQNGSYYDWVFLSKDKKEAIVLKVDVRKDKIISLKKRKAVML